MGLAFNLEENSVGAIILGDYLKLQEGDEAKTTGKLLSVPVGESVLDPLGNPLDGKGPVVTNTFREVESPAPGISDWRSATAFEVSRRSRPAVDCLPLCS